ncbi:MAG: carboxypeptidase-like regulatory domain-containing protein [Pirellulaceae bacterium]
MKRYLCGMAWGVVALGLIGCGGDPTVAKVSGTVTLDGEPVEGASVIFSPIGGGRPATGQTDSQGNFQLSTYGSADGALIAEHQVSVVKVEETKTAEAYVPEGEEAPEDQRDALSGDLGTGGRVKYLVPMKYAIGKTSGIKVQVERGLEPVALELTSK